MPAHLLGRTAAQQSSPLLIRVARRALFVVAKLLVVPCLKCHKCQSLLDSVWVCQMKDREGGGGERERKRKEKKRQKIIIIIKGLVRLPFVMYGE